jgi:hypothetical protein
MRKMLPIATLSMLALLSAPALAYQDDDGGGRADVLPSTSQPVEIIRTCETLIPWLQNRDPGEDCHGVSFWDSGQPLVRTWIPAYQESDYARDLENGRGTGKEPNISATDSSGSTGWWYDVPVGRWKKQPPMNQVTLPAKTLSGNLPPSDLQRLTTITMPPGGVSIYNKRNGLTYHVDKNANVTVSDSKLDGSRMNENMKNCGNWTC